MRRRPGLPLSMVFNGIDADHSRALEKLASARDIINDNGRLVRRPAWRSIGAGPVLFRPAGRTVVAVNGAQLAGRVCSSASSVDAAGWIYIGGYTPFDGFHWGDITARTHTTTDNRVMEAQVWNGAAWVNQPILLDGTNAYDASSTGHVPFLRDGKVHFRPLSTWAITTVASALLYWVRVRMAFIQTDGTFSPDQDDVAWTMVQPGIRVFDRAPVNGLRAGNISGRFGTIVCADNDSPTQMEPGASIGFWRHANEGTKDLLITERTTCGFWGQVPHATAELYTDSPRPTTTAGDTGTASRFTDRGNLEKDDGYGPGAYDTRRPVSVFAYDVAPSALGTTTSFTTTDAAIIALQNNALNHFVVQVTTSGGGPTLGRFAQITNFSVTGGVATVTLSPALNAAPTTSTRFAIARPVMKLDAIGPDKTTQYGSYDLVGTGTSTTLVPDTSDYAEAPTSRLGSASFVHFEIKAQPRWNLPRGARYCIVPDPLDGSSIITNGGPPLKFDGVQLTLLKTAPEDDPRVEAVLGVMPAFGPNPRQDPRTIAYEAMFYRQPPAGKFWAVHNGSFFVSGLGGEIDGAKHRIQWSFPGTRRDLWPRTNEAAIRDTSGRPIRGLSSYYDRVIAFTELSLHEGAPTEAGGYNFRQVSGSIGFTSHDAVQKVPVGTRDVLVGPAPDGLAGYSGGQPVYLIDRWDRAVPEGVDPTDLFQAPGAVWRQRGFYLLGLTPKGGTSRNLLLVFDYVNTRTWVWTMPFGIGALHVVAGPSGTETLVVGTEDGFLATLTSGDLDDGTDTIAGYLQTHPIPLSPAGENVRVARITADVFTPGDPHTMSLALQLDDASQTFTSGDISTDTGESEYGAGLYGTARYGIERAVHRPVNVPRATQCRELSLRLGLSGTSELRSLAVEFDVLTQSR
jgi:hypothetical protein